jgi:hypothetical protein
MSFFLAILFFCTPDACQFYQESEMFKDEAHCQAVVVDRARELEQKDIRSFGACLHIDIASLKTI